MSRIKVLMIVVSGLFMMIGIITMVSAGAEAAPLNEDSVPVFYENIIQVENPDSLSVLVNKNYSLPEDYEPDDLVFLEVPLYNNDKSNEANYLRKEAADALKELDCDVEIVTDTISRRTDGLIEESDVLLFLPGGVGTIYELFTAIECKKNGEFDKPIIIYNSNNFFDKLLDFLEKIYNEYFTDIKVKECYLVMNSVNEVIEHFKNMH